MKEQMGIYIADDDDTMIEILSDMIEDRELGTVVGASEDGIPDPQEILAAQPDIVLVDFLMPGMDGPSLIRTLKKAGCTAKFVMISQVAAKDMIGKAYDAGIEFFISKPVNVIEVTSVLGTVTKQIRNERTIANLRSMFLQDMQTENRGKQERPAAPAGVGRTAEREREEYERRLAKLLSRLGMAGEKGCEDIIRLCVYLRKNRKSISQVSIRDLCGELSEAPKSMEQRVRRAIAAGLSTMAHLGIEDYMNETFSDYSSTLFPFEEVRAEMDYIRGKRAYGGKAVIKKFVDGLMQIADNS